LGLEIAADRRFQFDAIAEEPIEGTISQPVYLLDVPRRADVVAVALSWKPRDPNNVGGIDVTVYDRRYLDRPILVPPDSAAPAFPVFDHVPGRSIGLSVAGTVGLPTGLFVQGSYTRQTATERIASRNRPTSWDAPNTLNVYAAQQLGDAWSVTSAFQFRSGTATTPVTMRVLVPLGFQRYGTRFTYGDPNSVRLSPYQRLDVGLRRRWKTTKREWTASAQILNLLNRSNALSYNWSAYFACANSGQCGRDAVLLRRSLPILPSVGIEVKW
jgi:hypothetical protein